MTADGELLLAGRFPRAAVRATLVATPRPSTPALEALIAERWTAAQADAQRHGRELFDGALLRWIDGALVPATATAAARVELSVAPGSYRDFAATNLAPDLRPQDRGGALPWSHFGNAVGTSALVIAGDGHVVAGRRSERVFGLPGYVHAFGGMLEPVDWQAGAATVDVFASMERELAEELAIAPHEWRELLLLGVLREPELDQPELLFAATTALGRAELGRRFERAPSRHEHAALVDLPRGAAARAAALARLERVSAVTRTTSRLLGDV